MDDLDVDARASRWAEIIGGGKTILVAEDAPGIVAWATEGTGWTTMSRWLVNSRVSTH